VKNPKANDPIPATAAVAVMKSRFIPVKLSLESFNGTVDLTNYASFIFWILETCACRITFDACLAYTSSSGRPEDGRLFYKQQLT
jgi:hypothetical protein